MARARNIKPGFFKNELLVEMPFETRLLFVGLWTIADRAGRLEDRPKKIKMELFPADNLDIDAMLIQLQKSGFIVRYSAEEQQYIQIVNFDKHQNPHCKEPASIIPAPCEHGASTVQDTDANSSSTADSLIPDSLPLIPESTAQTSCATPPQAKPRKKRNTPIPEDFAISDSVREWAAKHNYGDLPSHLEAFRNKCLAKGYKYADWDRAFMEAVRTDWAGLRKQNGTQRHAGFSERNYDEDATPDDQLPEFLRTAL